MATHEEQSTVKEAQASELSKLRVRFTSLNQALKAAREAKKPPGDINTIVRNLQRVRVQIMNLGGSLPEVR